jgi:hypothetical protein
MRSAAVLTVVSLLLGGGVREMGEVLLNPRMSLGSID